MKWNRNHTLLVVAAVVLAVWCGTAKSSSNHTCHLGTYSPGICNVENGVYWGWCGHEYVHCSTGDLAWNISGCESTHRTWARNGEHEGLFQMGSGERKRFGGGSDPWSQSEAAHNYYEVSGLSPWYSSESCWS